MKKLILIEKLDEAQKSLLGFGTALVILLGLIVFCVIPMFKEATFAKNKAVEIKQKLLIYEDYAKMKNLGQKESQQKQMLQSLQTRLPSNLKQEEIIQDIYVQANKFKIKLMSLKQMSNSKKKELPLALHCKGEYKSVLKFLQALETEGSLKVLQDVILKGEERNGNLELTATIVAYKS